VVLSKGFVQFQELVRSLIRRGQQDGSLRAEFSDVAVTAAVMGAVEGMLRERLVAERAGRRAFAEREIRRVFAALLTGSPRGRWNCPGATRDSPGARRRTEIRHETAADGRTFLCQRLLRSSPVQTGAESPRGPPPYFVLF
jgi:hypothetical protein